MNDYDFFKTSMPQTRKADFYLGCLDSSVFIDFCLHSNGQIYLQRISFDGYGCCEIENSKTLDQQDSIKFIEEMNKETIDQNTIELLVKSLIDLNSENIWTDALEEYKLIENKNYT